MNNDMKLNEAKKILRTRYAVNDAGGITYSSKFVEALNVVLDALSHASRQEADAAINRKTIGGLKLRLQQLLDLPMYVNGEGWITSFTKEQFHGSVKRCMDILDDLPAEANLRPSVAEIEAVAKHLEDFARQVEVEAHMVPSIPKSEVSWRGFTYEAERVLEIIHVLPIEDALKTKNKEERTKEIYKELFTIRDAIRNMKYVDAEKRIGNLMSYCYNVIYKE